MDIQLVNLERLISEKLYGTPARDALICLQTRGTSAGKFIDPRTVDEHSADILPFRSLANFYSTCEFAALLGVVPATLPRLFAADSVRFLRNRAFKRLYQKMYPNLMVDMFRLRLEGEHQITVPVENAISLFLSFLELNQTAEELERIEPDHDLQLALKAMDSPISQLSEASNEEQHAIEKFAITLRSAGDFWIELRDYIANEQPVPIVRSACWHHFAPTIRHLGPRTNYMLNKIRPLADKDGNDWAISVHVAIDSVAIMKYSDQLEQAYSEILRERPQVLREQLVDVSSSTDFKRAVREHWAQLEPPHNREEIRSLANALEAVQDLGKRIGYSMVISRMTEQWNEWMRTPREGPRMIRHTAEWLAALQTEE